MKVGEAYVEMAVDRSKLGASLNAARAQTVTWTKDLERSLNSTLDRAMQNVGANVASDKKGGILDSLKTRFGRGSDFKEGFEVLLGGGAIAGLGLAARAFKGVTDEVAALSVRFREGELSGGEFVGELARSIPVVGTLARAFDSLWDAVAPGESAAGLEAFAKRQNEIMDRTQEGIDRELEARRRLKQLGIDNSREVHRVINDPNRQIGVAAGVGAFERGILDAEAKRREAQQKEIAALERQVGKEAERAARLQFEQEAQIQRGIDLEETNQRIRDIESRIGAGVNAGGRTFSGSEGDDFASTVRGREFGQLTEIEKQQLAELKKTREVIEHALARGGGGAVFQ